MFHFRRSRFLRNQGLLNGTVFLNGAILQGLCSRGLGLGALLALFSLACHASSFAQESKWVERGSNGRLVYTPDAEGDRLPDFSDVGYRGGKAPLPSVPVVVRIDPIAGDNTAHIQAAIDQVAAMPLDANGFRGAVRLSSGTYDIFGQLQIRDSGIVLRGAGRSETGTLLQARGTDQRDLIQVFGSGQKAFTGSKRKMVDKVVPVGSRSFHVNSTNGLAVGDSVRITRPANRSWIDAIGMNTPDVDWPTTQKHLRFDRKITRIEGKRVFVDAPLTNAFELEYGIGKIQKFTWNERINNVGIEHLRTASDFASDTDEDHSWNSISIDKAEDVWVAHVSSYHFARSSVVTGPGAKHITVDRVRNFDPKSEITGGRRYAFDMSGQLELVTRARSENGRHDFISSDKRAPGPHVFHQSRATGALNDSGPHQRWITGVLFDKVKVYGNQLNIRNRGDFGSGQGWSGANSVIFNSTADGFIVQNPPTAQNWLIGSKGPIIEDTTFGSQPSGNYDSHGDRIAAIPSLYEAQVADAATLANGRTIEQRDYLYGDIDNFSQDGAGSVDDAYIDPNWKLAIENSSSNPVTGFDDLTPNRNVGFTAQYQLDAGEEVIHATLALALRQTGNLIDTDFIRLFTPNATYKFFLMADLGWDAISTDSTFVGVLDLSPFLSELQGEKINVQLNDDVAVDWAILGLSVAQPAGVGSPAPEPTSTTLLLLGVACFSAKRRGRKTKV